jgi:hypothetical protein
MIPARIFIASSSEGKPVAQAVKQQFADFEQVDIWYEDVFQINHSYFDSLNRAANLYDFAIVCLTPDDLLSSRGQEQMAPRDNVLFELGLFMGRLGTNRAFVVADEKTRILSDLQGITLATYRHPTTGSMMSAVGNACAKIRNVIEAELAKSSLGFLPSTSLAIGYFNNFVVKVVEGLEDEEPDLIDLGDGSSPVHLDFKDYHLRILIPARLVELENRNLKNKVRDLKQVQIKTKYRSFPFFIGGNFEPDAAATLQLIDIPTTIRASKEIIEKIFPDTGLGGNKQEREALEEREIKNFKKALEYLVAEQGYNDNISIEWL